MLKKPWKYFFIKSLLPVILLFIGCAPKAVSPPPPQIQEGLSLEEIISKAGSDILILKAIADIRIEKNSEFFDQVTASVVMKRPAGVHMRMYKFGMLVSDFILDEERLVVLAGKNDSRTAQFLDEFYRTVFWWASLEGSALYRQGKEYVISSPEKEIRIDSTTLLPLQQDIVLNNKLLHITYAEPRDYDGFWYPSAFDLHVEDFRFRVKVDKMIKNPVLSEHDFKVPAE